MEHDGESVSENLGGDCLYVADILVQELREKGYEPYYIEATDSRHVGVICKNEQGQEFILEPTMPGLPPIAVKDLYPEGSNKIFPRFPVVNGHPSICRAEIHNAIFASLKFEIIQKARIGIHRSPYVSFEFNLNDQSLSNPRTQTPLAERLPRFHIALTLQETEKQNTISVTKNVHDGTLKIIDGQKGIIKRQFGTRYQFKKHLEKLCERLGTPPAELLEIFAESVDIRNRIAKENESILECSPQ